MYERTDQVREWESVWSDSQDPDAYWRLQDTVWDYVVAVLSLGGFQGPDAEDAASNAMTEERDKWYYEKPRFGVTRITDPWPLLLKDEVADAIRLSPAVRARFQVLFDERNGQPNDEKDPDERQEFRDKWDTRFTEALGDRSSAWNEWIGPPLAAPSLDEPEYDPWSLLVKDEVAESLELDPKVRSRLGEVATRQREHRRELEREPDTTKKERTTKKEWSAYRYRWEREYRAVLLDKSPRWKQWLGMKGTWVPFHSYILWLARSRALDDLRHQAWFVDGTPSFEDGDRGPSSAVELGPAIQAVTAEERRIAWEVMSDLRSRGKLDDLDMMILVMRYWVGAGGKHTSAVLAASAPKGISPASVHQRLSRARIMIRDELGGRGIND